MIALNKSSGLIKKKVSFLFWFFMFLLVLKNKLQGY